MKKQPTPKAIYMKAHPTKTLEDVTQDLSSLYENFKAGLVDRADADSMANISGKIIKIEQIKLAREIFITGLGKRVLELPGDST